MPSTTTQRKLASQFVAVTNATKENAQQYLKNANYNLDAAVNLYFNSAENDARSSGGKSRDELLNDIFNGIRSEEDKTGKPDTPEDTIGVSSIMEYASELGINMENYEFFVLCEIVQVEVMGEMTRKGFVEGWKKQSDERGRLVDATLAAQKRFLRARIDALPRDPALFKSVYRRAFFGGRETAQQKAISLEVIALPFWTELFSPNVHPWKTPRVDWLAAWKRYLEDIGWKRGVNKDMWNQTLEFAEKTMQDDTLSFWNEDQAWPGVIDDFVVWCKENNILKSSATAKGGDGMEVDD